MIKIKTTDSVSVSSLLTALLLDVVTNNWMNINVFFRK